MKGNRTPLAEPIRIGNSYYNGEPTTGWKATSGFQEKEWRVLEKREKQFWKEIEKHKITYRGHVFNLAYLGGGWHKKYSFSCERTNERDGPVPSIGVMLRTRKDIQSIIFDGDILRLQGKLRQGKPFEPDKIFNETKGTLVKF
jgi:hypothetical protein